MDMSLLESIQISDANLMWIGITAALLFILPLIYVIVWRKKCGKQARFKALLIGAIGFFVTVRVLELAVHMFCIVLDNPVSRMINGNIFLYVIYGITMAGVFEEVGRYVILKYLVKKENTLNNAVMYGIGHGGIEVWVITMLAMVSYLVIGVMFRSLPLEDALVALNITEDTAASALPSLQAIAAFGSGSAIATVLERVMCMFVHIGLTMIVYAAVKQGEKKYLLLAIALHMIMDTLPAISQKTSISLVIAEGWILVWTIVIMVLAKRVNGDGGTIL